MRGARKGEDGGRLIAPLELSEACFSPVSTLSASLRCNLRVACAVAAVSQLPTPNFRLSRFNFRFSFVAFLASLPRNALIQASSVKESQEESYEALHPLLLLLANPLPPPLLSLSLEPA